VLLSDIMGGEKKKVGGVVRETTVLEEGVIET
jgi:hypothetical protein